MIVYVTAMAVIAIYNIVITMGLLYYYIRHMK